MKKSRFIRLIVVSGFIPAEIEGKVNEAVRSIQENGGNVVSLFPQNVSGADVYQIIYESTSEIRTEAEQKAGELHE
ncbi:MAG: hypothetical protein K2J32_00855 [Ruminococcus sp.]|nr:hypothetical protein [Ruminococcus sp.]